MVVPVLFYLLPRFSLISTGHVTLWQKNVDGSALPLCRYHVDQNIVIKRSCSITVICMNLLVSCVRLAQGDVIMCAYTTYSSMLMTFVLLVMLAEFGHTRQ